ncbi:hypothetical protein EDB92DRAFT_1892123, partial [Lactarius akahatsu]
MLPRLAMAPVIPIGPIPRHTPPTRRRSFRYPHLRPFLPSPSASSCQRLSPQCRVAPCLFLHLSWRREAWCQSDTVRHTLVHHQDAAGAGVVRRYKGHTSAHRHGTPCCGLAVVGTVVWRGGSMSKSLLIALASAKLIPDPAISLLKSQILRSHLNEKETTWTVSGVLKSVIVAKIVARQPWSSLN